MSQWRPFIFSVAAVWSAADALFAKILRTALDLAPDSHPGLDRASIFIHLSAIRAATG